MRNPVALARLATAFINLTRDLGRLDQVFALNEQIVALRTPDQEAAVVADVRGSEVGAAALRERPRLGRLDLDLMRALPAATLGGAYARFLDRNGIRPDDLPERRVDDDMSYLRAHYYETHDVWHVVTGFEADLCGELGLQAFLLAQSRSYLPLLIVSAALLNTALYAYEERTRRMDSIVRGWTLGKRSRRLVGIDWRPLLHRPLAEVRRELGLQAEAEEPRPDAASMEAVAS